MNLGCDIAVRSNAAFQSLQHSRMRQGSAKMASCGLARMSTRACEMKHPKVGPCTDSERRRSSSTTQTKARRRRCGWPQEPARHGSNATRNGCQVEAGIRGWRAVDSLLLLCCTPYVPSRPSKIRRRSEDRNWRPTPAYQAQSSPPIPKGQEPLRLQAASQEGSRGI